MVCLRVPADDQRELQVREVPQQLLAPRRGAFGAWRGIPSLARAWETKTHRKDRYAFRVVEGFRGQTQPIAKAIAARVCEGHARFMNLAAWRLSRHQDARVRMQLEYRPWTKR